MCRSGAVRTTIVWLIAVCLLTTMCLLMLGSAREDSLTYDEPAHIAAGYTYLRFRDARLNPEHPPLLKMLAAVPLLMRPLQFPRTASAWQDTLNGQWEAANVLLYESGNDPHHIATQARLMPIMLTVLLGLLLFVWMRRFAGVIAALLTLFWYTFSPTTLAHGRLVTTDVAAAFGVVLVGFSCIRFLQTPGSKSALLTGLVFGLALLGKFSTILLMPFAALLTLLWAWLEPSRRGRYLWGWGIISVSAGLLLLLPYLWITARYPPARQLWDTYWTFFHMENGPAGRVGNETAEEYFALLQTDRTRDLRACTSRHTAPTPSRLRRCPLELVIFLADKPLWRAWGQYLFGLLLTIHRGRAGGTADFPFYFFGEVSATGWWHYFPVVYAIREPLPLHILTVFALLLALAKVWSGSWGSRSILRWLKSHVAETFMLGWIILYWGTAIGSNLNIGVRHLLPVFPFTFMLVSREMRHWGASTLASWRRSSLRQSTTGVVLACLLTWHCVSVLRIYPSFLAYFNEAAGGPEGGANYVVDFDWGQDLARLRQFVEARRIDKIAVDYFGTSSPRSELGEKFMPWWSARGPYQGWLAISTLSVRIAQGKWTPPLRQTDEQSYQWLQGKEPVAKIGYTILVFRL